jgi:hypothetical protein
MRLKVFKFWLKYAALVLLIPGLLLLTALPLTATSHRSAVQPDLFVAAESSSHLSNRLLLAQRVRPLEVGQQVYDRLPDLPLENQYISVETGQPATSSTLISRLIRYHTLIRGRAPNYRFDWKLTLADYLGANELIRSAGYPGHDTLTVNPLANDVAAIARLNRAQRDALVNTLVAIFTTSAGDAAAPPNPPPAPRPAATPIPRPTPAVPPAPVQPRPGDAQLLR